jgi:N-acetylglucosaminyldiphosphoundecaprenol N-acetyl-beta-D-mannosaminyltransferase
LFFMTSALIFRSSSWMEVLDVPVDILSTREIEEWVLGQLATGDSCAHVVTLNPEYVMTARRDPAFAAVLREADLSTIDGVGISLAVKLLRPGQRADRVTGVSLCWRLAEVSARTGDGIFLVGAGPGVADAAGERLIAASPGAVIAGTWSEGSPGPSDDAETIRRIAGSGARIVLVAYGAPSQIHWIARNQDALSVAGVKLVSGIGGALDYISGNVPWAPAIVRKLGLEWAHRLAREPWRWRRQLVLPHFALLVVREAVGQRLRSRT